MKRISKILLILGTIKLLVGSGIGFGYLIRNNTTKNWEDYVQKIRNKCQQDREEQYKRYKKLEADRKKDQEDFVEVQSLMNKSIADCRKI